MPDIIAQCNSCGQDFAIIPLEQEILEKLQLPHPQACHFCRKKRRHKTRMRGRFYEATCQKCGTNIHVTVDPESNLMIYCKDCYMTFKASGESEKIHLDL